MVKKSAARVADSTISITKINAEMKKSQEKWICFKERRFQALKYCLLDFGNAKATRNEKIDEKTKKR